MFNFQLQNCVNCPSIDNDNNSPALATGSDLRHQFLPLSTVCQTPGVRQVVFVVLIVCITLFRFN